VTKSAVCRPRTGPPSSATLAAIPGLETGMLREKSDDLARCRLSRQRAQPLPQDCELIVRGRPKLGQHLKGRLSISLNAH
jgi:hypothetical protein